MRFTFTGFVSGLIADLLVALFVALFVALIVGLIVMFLVMSSDVTIKKEIDIISLANLIAIIVLAVTIPTLVHPYTYRVRQAKESLIDEINQYLSLVEGVRDWLCELPKTKISADNHREVLFQFKKLRQHLRILEKEIGRLIKKHDTLSSVKTDLGIFWNTATESLTIGQQLSGSYMFENLTASSKLQISLKELRFLIYRQ